MDHSFLAHKKKASAVPVAECFGLLVSPFVAFCLVGIHRSAPSDRLGKIDSRAFGPNVAVGKHGTVSHVECTEAPKLQVPECELICGQSLYGQALARAFPVLFQRGRIRPHPLWVLLVHLGPMQHPGQCRRNGRTASTMASGSVSSAARSVETSLLRLEAIAK